MRIPPFIGLCAVCRHAQIIKSSRGSVFIKCGLAKTDSRFSKYPVLPMLHCSGFQPAEESEADETA